MTSKMFACTIDLASRWKTQEEQVWEKQGFAFEHIAFEMLMIVAGYVSVEFKELPARDNNVGVTSTQMAFKAMK